MMAKLRDKLNVLVQSGLRGALPGERPKRQKSGDVEKQVAALRAAIDRALDAEDRLTGEIAALDAQIQTWDQQADAALQRGDDAAARHAVHQMQLAQQQKGLRGADLDQHRYETSDLIRRVNTLEALVAESQQARTSNAPGGDPPRTEQRSARLAGEVPAQAAPAQAALATDDSVSAQAVEDDLARRRARLSL